MPAGGDGALPANVRRAAAVLIAEAAGLVALGAVVLVKVATGSPSSVAFAAIAGLMAMCAGAVLVMLSCALRRGRGWAYVPVIVVQGLALPVGYSLAVQAGLWQYGGPVLLLAVVELYLLVTPSARRALGPGSQR